MDLANKIKILQNQYSVENYSSVIQGCKKILKISPSNTYVLNLCGLSLQNMNDQESAIIFFKEAILSDKKNFAAMNNLANSYRAKHEYDKAEELYLTIIQQEPNNLKAVNNYANLKNSLNHFKEAIELYSRAIKIKPNDTYLLFRLAASYQSIGEFEQTKKIIEEILRLDSKNTSAYKMISSSTKFTKENIKLLDEILVLSEDESLNKNQKIDLFFALGKIYEDLKEFDKSFEYLKKANFLQKEKFLYKKEEDEKLFSNIIKTFDKINFNQFKKHTKEKEIIFICGMPRSGTTLVEQICASHKEVSGAGELGYLEYTVTKNFLKNNNFDVKKIIDEGLSEDNIIQSEYMKFLNFHKFSTKIVTDKAPPNFRWIGFLKIFFPNCKIIHCSRNAKDNCLSLFKNSFNSKSMMWSNSQKDIANYYNLYFKMMSFWKVKFNDSIYEAKYENLVNNPEEEIRNLLKFCNLDWDEKCLNFHENKKTPIQTVSLVQAREPIYKSSVNSNIGYSQYLHEMYDILDIN